MQTTTGKHQLNSDGGFKHLTNSGRSFTLDY